MTRAKDIALAHHMQVRDFCKALDKGQYVAGAPTTATASVRAGGSAPLALLLSSLGPKYGLTPVPADMLSLGFQARGVVEKAAITSHALSSARLGNIVPIALQAQTPAVNAAVQKLINDVQNFIAQVQSDPSNQQLLQSGLHFITDIANVYVTASQADQAQLDALKNRLINLGISAGTTAVTTAVTTAISSGSSPSDGSDPGF
jgi:hypothetical protein